MPGLFDGTPLVRPVTCQRCGKPLADCRCPRDAAGHNDVWVKIDDNAEALQANPTNTLNNGPYVKLLGGPVNNWGFGQTLDALGGAADFPAAFTLDAGVHTITFAGRTEGYHLDYWELFKGSSPGVNVSNSAFHNGPPPDDFLI